MAMLTPAHTTAPVRTASPAHPPAPLATDARSGVPAPRAVIELLKPITWFAPVWAYMCGVVSSGVSLSGRGWSVLLGLALAGPLVCGASQALNDWFDRHVDALNEPDRPIPSGRIPGSWGLYIGLTGMALSVVAGAILGPVALAATVVGLTIGWVYSAPPLRLKQNGWISCMACAACYEGLPWFTGAAIMAGRVPDAGILMVAALYSFGAAGIMALNDFKAVDGDRAMGLRSLPVVLGVDRAAQLACLVMALPQAVVLVMLIQWQRPWHAALIACSLLVQFLLMRRLLADPRANAPWYNATGTSLYVLGMLVGAHALAHLS
jgi:chlorophyll/bacteriochlorophyll a synthase